MSSGRAGAMWQSNPDKIDPEILSKGTRLLTFCAAQAWPQDIERWVQSVAKRTGEKVDWSCSGWSLDESDNNVNIIGLGDLDKITNAMKELLPSLNELCMNRSHLRWRKITESDIDELYKASQNRRLF